LVLIERQVAEIKAQSSDAKRLDGAFGPAAPGPSRDMPGRRWSHRHGILTSSRLALGNPDRERMFMKHFIGETAVNARPAIRPRSTESAANRTQIGRGTEQPAKPLPAREARGGGVQGTSAAQSVFRSDNVR
jgi:hypothetical protein